MDITKEHEEENRALVEEAIRHRFVPYNVTLTIHTLERSIRSEFIESFADEDDYYTHRQWIREVWKCDHTVQSLPGDTPHVDIRQTMYIVIPTKELQFFHSIV